ncbi:MAG: Ribosomal small subunit methyltransferase [Parcubacteria group bacterium]|nr:Ribosomal small subunit methyltransferase [Parcubacteria group bacterium]
METRHDSVLLHEAIAQLNVQPGDVAVDATLGGAGHFRELAVALGHSGTLVGIDADQASIERAETVVKEFGDQGPTVHLVKDNFRDLARILDDLDLPCLDRALFDLGWNSFQLSAGRGFSFRADEPLLMTYGEPEQGKTAADLVNSLPEEELADLIYTYGEERFSRGIARSIVETRKHTRILTTLALAEAVERGTPSWYQNRRLHPATKTFQALRIATNDELGALREGLAAALERLTQGGRIAVITFHSIEDRIVKGVMKDAAYAGQGSLVTRKPMVPSPEELTANPRARSAKLRVFERCNGEGVCITKPTSVHMYV